MITYNIYGVGAALVDNEVQVSGAFLSSANIDKDVRTLVDKNFHPFVRNYASYMTGRKN